MNIFSSCGTNSCLYILILLLLAASASNCNGLEGVLSGSCIPLLIALIYSMWKNGTLQSLLGGNCNSCGCGCN